jgi:diadenosine tetraphosphate (Ap4A) HIT family hydrolase
MVEIEQLEGATLFLFRNQTYRGRCIVAADKHVDEIYELSESERNVFLANVARVARALKVAFEADKINYGTFGDTMPHLHVHIVPKFVHGPDWGKPFQMNPQPAKTLSKAGYQATIDLIRQHLRV